MQIKSINQKEMLPGFKVRIVHSEKITMAFWEVTAGAVLPEHHHIQEQIAMIEEGEFELTVNGKSTTLKKGDVLVIPSSAVHSGRALTACKMTDIFAPVREDWL